MTTLKSLQKEIDEIKKRNKKVEVDKLWETSDTRRVVLISLTYITTGLYLQAVNVPDPWMNAIGAALGFLLSTLTMPYFRKLWEKRIKTK